MKKKVSPFHQLDSSSQKPVCLVAGGAGFIGSYLCESLLTQRCQVICLDNLLTGKKENLAKCYHHQNFTFIKHDLTKPLEKRLPKIDYLFHLAGIEAYFGQEDTSLNLLKVNAAGTTNLLELARQDKAKFLLISSFDIYSAALPGLSFKDYQGQFSYHEAKRFAENLVFEYSKKYQVDARIVRLGQVYGPRMNLGAGTKIVSLIKEVLAGGPLKIPGKGKIQYHPTFVTDIVEGLLRAMFISGSSGRIFSLADIKETTLLFFAHELQKQSSGSLSIEFVPGDNEEKFPLEKEKFLTSQKFLGWQPKVELKEGIEKTLASFLKKAKTKTPAIEKLPKPKKEIKSTRFHPSWLMVFGAFFLILTVLSCPLLSLGFDCLWGVRRLKQAEEALLSAQSERGLDYSSSAQNSFTRARKRIDQFEWFFDLIGLEGVKISAERDLGIGQNLAGAIHHGGLAAQAGEEVAAIIFQNQEGETQKLTGQIKTELDLAYADLSQIQAGLEKAPVDSLFRDLLGLNQIEADLTGRISQLRSLILEAREGIEILPELIAVREKRTYLVLFQNNMELRPTGGFIGSFALVTFENGHFIDFEVQNVYTADGQLKGHVEPPPEIKKYLGEAGWYLRDSNFDPDFPTSAIKAEWFLEKEIGRSVDGVLAVNLDFARKILEVAGEVELPDYQEKINAVNFFERAQYQAEVGFFPGSTQKEDFLGSLTRILFDRVRNSHRSDWYLLGKAVYNSLSEKDLLVYLHDQKAAETMGQLGWDGGIKEVKCQIPETTCFADYLMIVETNFGVNKVNYFVKRELTHKVNLADDGTVEATLQIIYQNESPSENFPAGQYKNYLRLYLPKETILKQVAFDGRPLGEKKIDVKESSGKTIFGFLVEVPIKEKKKVQVTYQLGKKMDWTRTKTTYLLLIQRQSGSSQDSFNFWLNYPSSVTPLKAYPSANLAQQTLFFNPILNRDLVFRVDFAK